MTGRDTYSAGREAHADLSDDVAWLTLKYSILFVSFTRYAATANFATLL